MSKISINLSFYTKLFFILMISLAPLLDNNLIASGIANVSSPRLSTYPIFVCLVNLLAILFMFYKSNKIQIYRTDIPWILLTILILVSNFFSITSYEDKLSFLLVIISSVIVSIYLSSDKNDGFESLISLILIFSFIALSIFFIRLQAYGNISIARGGLNIYTISGVISWLLLLSILFYQKRSSRKFRQLIYFINILITVISIVSANRMGLIASMLVWMVLFIKYNKGFLITMFVGLVYLGPLLYSYIAELYIFVRFGGYNIDLDFFIEIFMGSRGYIWIDSWNLWREFHPLFGTGLGGFHYYIIDGSNLDSAHNFFLNILVEHGIIGSLLIFLMLFAIFKDSIKNAFYFTSIFFIYLFLSGWTIIQPVGFISAFNLIVIILFARSALPELERK